VSLFIFTQLYLKPKRQSFKHTSAKTAFNIKSPFKIRQVTIEEEEEEEEVQL